MASFAPIKAGSWAYGEILTSAQMNQLNTDFPFALNCRDGGSYTPSGTISLQTPATKVITLNGATFGALPDGGVTQLGDLLATTINVSSNALISGNLSVPAGVTTLDELNGSPRLTGVLIPFAGGRVQQRVINYTSDSDFSAGPGTVEFVNIQSGWLSADRNFTIVDDGDFDDAIEVEMVETVRSITVLHPTTLATLLVMKNASGFANWARFRRRNGGSFVVVAKYVVP